MGFLPPSMPLMANLWRSPNDVSLPPDRTFSCNLALGPRMLSASNGGTGTDGWAFLTGLLCPASTDIAGIITFGVTPDCVEVPAGSGRYYAVWFVEDSGRGFSNAYRFAFIGQLNTRALGFFGNPWGATPWPVPTP